ncbi:MAG: peptidoglycan-binding domain-containing protein [Candidatus Azambacteria bacterium]|nr:peptidoglycan-binding domain-containing protein [Candidatus Azambacteria bacterium]
MFITKQMSWPVALIALGAMLALTLSLSVPKAGAVTIDELMAQINALQAQLVALQGTTGAATACTFTKSLFLGVSDPQVKCLQQYLNGAGYAVSASGAGSVGSETNYYGSRTKAAVASWQAAKGVSPAVGYFGTISRAKYTSLAGVVTPPPGGVVTPPVGGGLSIGLSASTQAARTIVAGAANMSFGKFTFTAGSGDVTVTTMKFTKSGISADAEVGSAYLYDADSGDYLAQYSGLGSGILTFTNSSGLFVVKAGMTKNIDLRLDVSSSASNNHTMAWGLNAAADVTSNASSVSGAFPSSTNAMTFVTVSDPAIATLTATTVGTGDSVNAGTTGYLAGSFTLKASNSSVLLDRMVVTQNGSMISSTDVANVKLVTTGGQQIGAVLPNLNSDGKGTFVMSPAYEIPSGQTIQVNVYADILAGVNRTMKFNILNLRDVQARDKTYNIGVNPSASVAMTQSSVQAGTLTITLDPSSPTGNVAPGQSNVTVAKFKVTSYGEQVKVLFIPFKLVTGGGTTDFSNEVDNVYLVDDAGNQIGTTITSPDAATATSGSWTDGDSTAATFGTSASNINYLIPANVTRIWSLKLDVVTTATSTLTGSLMAGASNYQGQVSLSSGSTTAVSANALTVTSNPFQAKLNTAIGATGNNLVKGQGNARIGSWVLSASSAEGINVSTLTFVASTTFPFANLIAKVNGVQFGNIDGSVTAADTETFAGASPAAIPSGGNITVDLYADVLSTATNLGGSYYAKLTSASAVGAVTATTQTLKDTGATAVTSSAAINAQAYTINVSGPTITVDNDSSSPAAYQVAMGKTGQTLGIWKINGGTTEDTSITAIAISDKLGTAAHKTSFNNLQWYKSGVAIGPVMVAATASGASGLETGWRYTSNFSTPLVIPQNSGISLELRGDVSSFASGGATSNSTHTFTFNGGGDYLEARGAGSSLDAAVTDTAATAIYLGTSTTTTSYASVGGTSTDVNAVTVARTKLTVVSDPAGITTTGHPASTADVMAYFVFTADPNYDVTINTVTLKLAGSTLTSIYVQLIDDSTGTAWGSTVSGYTGNSGLNSNLYGQLGGSNTAASSSISFYPAYVLSAGATKKVRVVADTTGSQNGNDVAFTATAGNTNGTLAQWYIANDTTSAGGSATYNSNALCWGDGTTLCSAGAFNLEAKVLPIYGPSVRY